MPAQPPTQQDVPTRPGAAALRALGYFWLVVLVVLAAGAAALQFLGPPAGSAAPTTPPAAHGDTAAGHIAVPDAVPPHSAPPPADAPAPQHTTAPPQVVSPPDRPPVPARILAAPRAPGAPVPPPDPMLQEPSGLGDGHFLPRIAGGLASMRAYAAGAAPMDARPRVAILLADFAMREADSDEALRQLPAAVSFAVSPYAARPEALVQRARQAGHELLISLPMEPRGYPLDDPGDRAMLTGALPDRNTLALRWALSRLGGAVGATGALGGLRGERFAASEQMGAVLDELGRRGLLYVDPRPGGQLPAASGAGPRRAVDLVVDEPAVRIEIDANLARLEQVARDRGSAVGLVSAPTPVTVERLAAWSVLLEQRGLVLVPVSALVVPPAR